MSDLESGVRQHIIPCIQGQHNEHLCKPLDKSHNINPGGVGALLWEAMLKFSNNIAQIDCVTGEKDTYNDILTRSICIAQNMTAHGVTSDDIVSVCFLNNMNSYTIATATIFIGAKLAPFDPMLSLDETKNLLKMTKPKIIFCDDLGLKLMETAVNELKVETNLVALNKSDKHIPFSKFLTKQSNTSNFEVKKPKSLSETCLIHFSSGTTGTPKGICNSHFSFICKYEPYPFSFVFYGLTRMYWFSSFPGFFQTIISGGIFINDCEFDMTKIFKIIHDYKITIMFVPPYYASQMIKNKEHCIYDTSTFKILFILGGAISNKQMQLLKTLFPTTMVLSMYGITECCGTICMFPLSEVELMRRKVGSVGTVLPGTCMKIVDVATNKEVGPNEKGEIRIKTSYFMNGYLNDSEASANCLDEEGYFYSGDIGYYDEDYCFYVVDRFKDLIKFRSTHVAPVDIESVLQLHPSVAQVVVVATPHEEDGDHPTAIVVLKEGHEATEEELIKYVDENIEDPKRLRGGIKFVKDIPKTPTFKLRRRDLRNMIINGEL